MAELKNTVIWVGVAIILLAILITVFARDILAIAFNFIILYVCLMRMYFAAQKRLYVEFVVALVVSALLALLIGNFLPLWTLTTFVLVTTLVAEMARIVRREYFPSKKILKIKK